MTSNTGRYFSRTNSLIAVANLIMLFNGPPAPTLIIVLWSIINTVAVSIFSYDKYCAIHDKNRISEFNLLTLAFFGGFSTMTLVGQLIRHKTQKSKFQWPLLLIGFAHTLLLFVVSRP